MSDPCKKKPSSSACKSAKADLVCESAPESYLCKKLQREVEYAEVLEGKRTRADFNKKLEDAIASTESYLDYARTAGSAVNSVIGAVNTGANIYNDLVALSQAKAKCKILSPEELENMLAAEESVWDRIFEEYITPGDKFLQICQEECKSDILEAIEASGNNPSVSTFFALWESLTEAKSISRCAAPYLDRFFNMVPYMYYISMVLQKAAGDVLESMADSLTEEEQKEVWKETACGQEGLMELFNKAKLGEAGQIPLIPDIPHIPPIPTIRIPGVLDVLWAILTDAICFAICCLLEPLMTMLTEAIDESFKEWMEGWDDPSLEDDDFNNKFLRADKSLMPTLKKVNLNRFVPEEVLENVIKNKLVAEGTTVEDLREYITYVTEDMPSELISQRHVVHLLMGESDCKRLNVLLLVGYSLEDPIVDGANIRCPDNMVFHNTVEGQKCIAKGFLKAGLSSFPKPELNAEAKILKFWKYLGDNIDIFGALQESRAEEDCIPDFCITRDNWAKEQFIDLNNKLCALLNPEVGLPNISIESLLEPIGANQAIVDTMKLQVGTLYEMAEAVTNATPSDNPPGDLVSSGYLTLYETFLGNIGIMQKSPADATNIIFENITPVLNIQTKQGKNILGKQYTDDNLKIKLKKHMEGKSLTDEPLMDFFEEIKKKFGGKKYMRKVQKEFAGIKEQIKEVKIRQIKKRQSEERANFKKQ